MVYLVFCERFFASEEKLFIRQLRTIEVISSVVFYDLSLMMNSDKSDEFV